MAEVVFLRLPESWHNTWVEGWVTKTLKIGSFVMIDGGVLGFGVMASFRRMSGHGCCGLASGFSARVTFIREDGRVNLSMNQLKEVGRLEDSDRILDFLKERPNGAMPYSDETDADIIKQKFGISKGAFKRALGKLMRDGLVTQEGSWTKLNPEYQEAAAPFAKTGGEEGNGQAEVQE